MKIYENYLFDNEEELLSSANKELAIDENNDGLFKYKPELSIGGLNKYLEQINIVYGAFHAVCQLIDVDNLECCCGGDFISFQRVVKQIDNSQHLNESPRLSRDKMINLSSNELTKIIVDILLDRDNWSKDILYSNVLSDGDGNWLS